jgi:DNA-binding NarL/FixJ family response regulator
MREKIELAIAEDDIAYRKILIQSLQPYRKSIRIIIEASDGDELIKLVETNMPDVILLDFQMPFMDGLKTTKFLSDKYPNLKILILTAHNDESLLFQLIGAGAHGFLLKDLSIKEIARKIQLAYNDEYGLKGWSLKNIINAKAPASHTHIHTHTHKIKFSPREIQINSLLHEGLDTKAVANKLCISTRTVDGHISRMIRKAGVTDRPELITFFKNWHNLPK